MRYFRSGAATVLSGLIAFGLLWPSLMLFGFFELPKNASPIVTILSSLAYIAPLLALPVLIGSIFWPRLGTKFLLSLVPLGFIGWSVSLYVDDISRPHSAFEPFLSAVLSSMVNPFLLGLAAVAFFRWLDLRNKPGSKDLA